jgi:hypothetical protein
VLSVAAWNTFGPDPEPESESEAELESDSNSSSDSDSSSSSDSGSDSEPTSDREAVRTAEQAVNDAWIGRLLVAESQAEAVLGACVRTRERAAGRVRAARRSGDPAALARAQTDLRTADTGCGRAWEAHEAAGAELVRELRVWSRSTASRVRQTLTERL